MLASRELHYFNLCYLYLNFVDVRVLLVYWCLLWFIMFARLVIYQLLQTCLQFV